MCEQVGVVSVVDLVKLPSLWFWVELMDAGWRRGVGATRRRTSSDVSFSGVWKRQERSCSSLVAFT